MDYKNKLIRFSVGSFALGITLGNVQIALAQNSYAPLGIHAGSFYIFPVVEVGIGYDDNVFRLPDIPTNPDDPGLPGSTVQSDTAINAMASVNLNSDWNRHELNGYADIDLLGYKDFDSEDKQNYTLSGDGVIDILRGNALTGKAGYQHRYEDRNSLNSRERVDDEPVYGMEPTQYDRTFIGAGYEYQPARLQVLVDTNYETLEYDDVENVFGGIVDNSDRNRGVSDASLRLGYEVMPKRRLFIEGIVNNVNYDQELDNNGVERSSSGYRVNGGMSFDLTNLLVGDVSVGYLEQNYDDSERADISSNVAGVGLQWFPSRLTSIGMSIDKRVRESTQASASGYLSTIYGLDIQHELKRNIILGLDARYTNNDFTQNEPGQKENENIARFGLNGKYMISNLLYTSAKYYYETRDSDIALQEYTNNRALISVGANW